MIMTPTEVFPDNEVVKVDKTKNSDGEYTNAPTWHYKFNCTAGAVMKWALCTYTNVRTGEKNYSYFPKGGHLTTIYNGDTVSIYEIVFNDFAKNGSDYIYQYTLFQTDASTIAADTQYGDGQGLYDMYFGRGKIYNARIIDTPDTSTEPTYDENGNAIYTAVIPAVEHGIFIGKEIPNLKDAYYYTRSDGSQYLVGGAYIEVGEHRALIKTYNFSTGKITVEGSLPFNAGDTYRIFTNYFIDRPHYVKARDVPKCVVTVDEDDMKAGLIKCSCTYSHPNHVGIKYYKFYLQEVNISTGVGKTIDESEEIYDFKLKYTFPFAKINKTVNVLCDIATLDDKVYTFTANKQFPAEYTADVVSDFNFEVLENHTAKLSWKVTGSHTNQAFIFREDVNYNNQMTYIGDTNGTSFIDYTVANNHEYKYHILYGKEKPYTSDSVFTKWCGWDICSLKKQDNNFIDNNNIYSSYRIGEHWQFAVEIEDNDIVSNIGVNLHIKGEKPTTTRTVQDYESGTFTADLTQINCLKNSIDYNIDTVKKWNDFIKGDNPFLLKSHKGDVWIINVSDNPSRVYETSYPELSVKISYSWVQVDNINKSLVKG